MKTKSIKQWRFTLILIFSVIAVLFSIFGKKFTGIETYASAIGVSILCGVVISGIPGEGFLGEALIVSFYGFPLEALPIISMLGVLVDPIATMINSSGDTIAAMVVNRLLQKNRDKTAIKTT